MIFGCIIIDFGRFVKRKLSVLQLFNCGYQLFQRSVTDLLILFAQGNKGIFFRFGKLNAQNFCRFANEIDHRKIVLNAVEDQIEHFAGRFIVCIFGFAGNIVISGKGSCGK